MHNKQQWFSLVRRAAVTLGAFGAGAAAFLAAETDAFAQTFGNKGQLAITGENLFTFESARFAETRLNNLEFSETHNRFGFLYSQGVATPRGPQVGFHYFIIPSLSLGLTLGYEARGGTRTRPMGNGVIVTDNSPDISTFIIVPKVGYALMLGQVVGFWFRGGIGYFRIGETDGNDPREKQSQAYGLLAVDAYLVVTPLPHFGFYVGPQAALSFTGTRSQTDNMGITTSWSTSYRDIGLGTGLIGYFDL